MTMYLSLQREELKPIKKIGASDRHAQRLALVRKSAAAAAAASTAAATATTPGNSRARR